MSDELEWSRWPWNRCPAQTAQRERCDLRAEHKTPHVAERGLNADVVWSEHYLAVTIERLAGPVLADQPEPSGPRLISGAFDPYDIPTPREDPT